MIGYSDTNGGGVREVCQSFSCDLHYLGSYHSHAGRIYRMAAWEWGELSAGVRARPGGRGYSTSDAQAGFILGILYGTAMLCTWLLAAIAQPIWQDVWLIHGIRVGTAAVTAYIVFVAAAHVYGVVNSEPS